MKFMEKTLKLETDSLFNFISSAMIILIFAPFRLIAEVSKKVVFLSKDGIDKLLFVAVVTGLTITLAISALRFLKGSFSLSLGNFPVLLILAGDAILLCLYFVFNMSRLVAYSDLGKLHGLCKETNVEEGRTGGGPKACTEACVQVASALSGEDRKCDKEVILSEQAGSPTTNPIYQDKDACTAQANAELLEFEAVKQYQNRYQDGIQGYSGDCDGFSMWELAELSEQVKYETRSVYLSDETVSGFAQQLVLDDDGDDTLDEIPEDFTLCL